jgi:hypothetical protein
MVLISDFCGSASVAHTGGWRGRVRTGKARNEAEALTMLGGVATTRGTRRLSGTHSTEGI